MIRDLGDTGTRDPGPWGTEGTDGSGTANAPMMRIDHCSIYGTLAQVLITPEACEERVAARVQRMSRAKKKR